MAKRTGLALGLAMLVTAFVACACAAPPPESSAPDTAEETGPARINMDLAADGRSIAEAECAGCHAVGEIGESPDPAAPVFREVLSRYRADVLEEELIAGVQVAHPMPDFHFNPQAADALIAYLRVIQSDQTQLQTQ
jgi:mono/diheme cytochrome c family protein